MLKKALRKLPPSDAARRGLRPRTTHHAQDHHIGVFFC
jgi:hypothetical protein